jgi:hypothetical protein
MMNRKYFIKILKNIFKNEILYDRISSTLEIAKLLNIRPKIGLEKLL